MIVLVVQSNLVRHLCLNVSKMHAFGKSDTILTLTSYYNNFVVLYKVKLKYANCVLESFQYFCQISLKLILIILSYTVFRFKWCVFQPTVLSTVALTLRLSFVVVCDVMYCG